MKIRKFNNLYNVFLVDDGTLDTVIKVNGNEFRFDECSWARRPDGSFYTTRFRLLAEKAIEVYEEDKDLAD